MERTITVDIDKILGEIKESFDGFLSEHVITNEEEFVEAYNKCMSYLFYKLNNLYKLGILCMQEVIDEYAKGSELVNAKRHV